MIPIEYIDIIFYFLKWHIAHEFVFKWGWIGIYGSFSHEIIGFAIGLENFDIHLLFMQFKICWKKNEI
jgi:hypothetical protein